MFCPYQTNVLLPSISYLAWKRCRKERHLNLSARLCSRFVTAEQSTQRGEVCRNRFDRKIVDFVAFEPITGKIAFLIEIDDSSHNTARDAERDAITESAGYITIRHPARAKVTHAAIAATLRPYLPNAAA